MLSKEIIDQLPLFNQAGKKVSEEFLQYAMLKHIPARQSLAMAGDECSNFFILLSGRIRVYKTGSGDRDITLYYVNKNESCFITVYSILSRIPFPSYAISESELEMLLVPAHIFRDWLNRHEIWRQHLLNTMAIRLDDIFGVLDKVLFQRVDFRIADTLLRLSNGNGTVIEITHSKLASDVGTSRPVISRILDGFKQQGIISSNRGEILIIDRAKLLEMVKNFPRW